MGRFVKDVELNQPIDVVSMVMEDYIYHNRFSRTDWNGEMVFYLKDAHGKDRYLKWSYAGGVFHVEAWLKGPFGNEMDLDGTGGGASRREYRQSMEALISELKREKAEKIAGGHVGSDPLHHQEDYESEHGAWQQDTKWQQDVEEQPGNAWQQDSAGMSGRRNANTNAAGLILGIFAIIFSAQMPVIGLVLAIWGLKKGQQRFAGAGRALKILCWVAIAETVMFLISWLMIGFGSFGWSSSIFSFL